MDVFILVDDLEMRSQGIMTYTGKDIRDVDSFLRLGSERANQVDKYEIAIHSLTFWSRKLSEEEVEVRFTQGLYESF